MARLLYDDAGDGWRGPVGWPAWLAHVWRSPRPTLATTVAAITLVGLVLRIDAARGDLWLDEIWSYRLIDGVHRASDILLALPYDNNHVLNSLWLWLVGPDAASLLARCPAIVLGTLCVPVAARIGARNGHVAAVAAAMVFAVDETFVHFGSEARGYSGMILATLVAIDALERLLRDRPSDRDLMIYAGAVGFGTFSHLTMLEPVCVLCAVALLRLRHEEGWRMVVLHRARPILVATAAGLAPPVACLAISLAPGTLHTGLVAPFAPDAFAEGLGRLVRTTVGLPDGPGSDTATIVWSLVAVALCCLVLLRRVPAEQRFLPALAIIGLPMLHWVLRLPNPGYPRFYLTTAIGLALLGADAWARAWTGPVATRGLAGFAALCFLTTQGTHLAAFLAAERGHYADAVTFMRADGPTRFTVLPPVNFGETAAVVRWYAAKRAGADLQPVSDRDACAAPPTWLIVTRTPNEEPATGPMRIAGGGACPDRWYAVARAFPAHGVSGFVWTLFRIVDASR